MFLKVKSFTIFKALCTASGFPDFKSPIICLAKSVLEFFNVLNQRLATVEDNVFIKEPDGSMVSLTKHYQIQSEAQIAEAQAKAAAEAKSKETAEENK